MGQVRGVHPAVCCMVRMGTRGRDSPRLEGQLKLPLAGTHLWARSPLHWPHSHQQRHFLNLAQLYRS